MAVMVVQRQVQGAQVVQVFTAHNYLLVVRRLVVAALQILVAQVTQGVFAGALVQTQRALVLAARVFRAVAV